MSGSAGVGVGVSGRSNQREHMATNQAQTDSDEQPQTTSDDPMAVPAYQGGNPDSPASGAIWYRTDLQTLVGKLDNNLVDLVTGRTIGADFSLPTGDASGGGSADGDGRPAGGWVIGRGASGDQAATGSEPADTDGDSEDDGITWFGEDEDEDGDDAGDDDTISIFGSVGVGIGPSVLAAVSEVAMPLQGGPGDVNSALCSIGVGGFITLILYLVALALVFLSFFDAANYFKGQNSRESGAQYESRDSLRSGASKLFGAIIVGGLPLLINAMGFNIMDCVNPVDIFGVIAPF